MDLWLGFREENLVVDIIMVEKREKRQGQGTQFANQVSPRPSNDYSSSSSCTGAHFVRILFQLYLRDVLAGDDDKPDQATRHIQLDVPALIRRRLHGGANR